MALHFEAASHFDENPEPLKNLINSTADLGRADRLGLTLLHYACREGHIDAVVALVEAGAPLEAKDRDARTPLHLACLMTGKLEQTRGRDHVAISNYLQYEGAIPSTQDKYGHTPLSYLPQRAKRLGLMTPSVDGQSAQWAVELVRACAVSLLQLRIIHHCVTLTGCALAALSQVGKQSSVLSGSVAQASDIRILRPVGY